MTMVRGGEERDLAAIVAMGRVRADHAGFHLDRDIDFIQYIVTTRRLLAGLGSAHARQLHFFIAEEGITAAAYVIVSVVGDRWTLEECGDRDASGARVGALLQALIAREPVERRPTIRAWLSEFSASAGRCGVHDAFDRNAQSASARITRDCVAGVRRRRAVLAQRSIVRRTFLFVRGARAIYPCDPSTLAPSAYDAIAVSSSGSPSASKPSAFVVVLG
jgi:hypothetical protein